MTNAPGHAQSDDESWVCLGTVTKPFGIRGGVRIRLVNPDSQSFRRGLQVQLRKGKEDAPLQLEVKAEHGGGRVTFHDITDRNRAETLRGFEVWIKRDDLPTLSDDEAYLIDFIGAQVYSEQNGHLGEITSIDIRTPQPLAKVKTLKGNSIEMPFVAGLIVGLSEEKREVWIDEPVGLFSGEVDVAEEEN